MPFGKRGTFTIGPALKYTDTDESKDQFINQEKPYGWGKFGELAVHTVLSWEGRDSTVFPRRGFFAAVRGTYFPKAWDVESDFGQVNGNLNGYFSAGRVATLALRVGGKKVFGTYPYMEGAPIGEGGLGVGALAEPEDSVRGYRARRYLGDASAWGNADLRLRVSHVTLLLPGAWGVNGFGDVGRVWLKGESSDTWHTGLGGGIWLSFLNDRMAFSGGLAHSTRGRHRLLQRRLQLLRWTKTIRVLLAIALALAMPVLAAADSPALASSSAPVLAPVDSPSAPPVTQPEPVRRGLQDGRRTMRRLPANLGHTTVGVWNADNLVPFLVGSVAAGSATFLDDTVRNSVDANQLGWGSTFETGGGPVYSTFFVAGMFTAGRFTQDTRFRAMTYDMLDAAIVNFAYTECHQAGGRARAAQRAGQQVLPLGPHLERLRAGVGRAGALRVEGRRPLVPAGRPHGRVPHQPGQALAERRGGGRGGRLHRRPHGGARERPFARAGERTSHPERVPDPRLATRAACRCRRSSRAR